MFQLLLEAEDEHVARAWFIGMNPQLDDKTPSDCLRTGQTKDVMAASRAPSVVADDVATVGSAGTLRWVGCNPEPLTVVAPKAHDFRGKRAGSRFDIASVDVLFCASTLEGCFAETLARFRPRLELAALAADVAAVVVDSVA